MFLRKLGQIREKRWLSLRFYDRFLHKYAAHDLAYELQRIARQESAAYVKQHMTSAVMYRNRWQLLEAALGEADPHGLFLEFGVEKGASVNFIARLLAARGNPSPVHGFDSFEGLPGEWSGTYERAGKFTRQGRRPPVLPTVQLHVGWFAETVAAFVPTTDRDIALLHIDCDIHASTKAVLDGLGHKLKPGSIVVFDEYFNYHNWQEHEFRAWQEFVAARGLRYAYRGFAGRGGQVFVKLLQA